MPCCLLLDNEDDDVEEDARLVRWVIHVGVSLPSQPASSPRTTRTTDGTAVQVCTFSVRTSKLGGKRRSAVVRGWCTYTIKWFQNGVAPARLAPRSHASLTSPGPLRSVRSAARSVQLLPPSPIATNKAKHHHHHLHTTDNRPTDTTSLKAILSYPLACTLLLFLSNLSFIRHQRHPPRRLGLLTCIKSFCGFGVE
jgi:hypothetical protein